MNFTTRPVLTISAPELERRWQTQLSERLIRRVKDLELRYHPLTQDARDAAVLKIIDALMSAPAEAGEHRLGEWESGWAENLSELKESRTLDAIIPRYFGKHQIVRWDGDFVEPVSSDFEYHFLSILVQWAMETWLSDVDEICELGCGPGYHLLSARNLFPDKALIGLDWTTASQDILTWIREEGLAARISGRRFDFFSPDESLELGQSVGVYSVAALEQIGDRHEPLIQFLLRKRPRVCVHLEPLDELLDGTRLPDRLSLLYSRKRNYLRNFLSRLRELENEGRLRIHCAQRTWTGSLFLEGHSLVVWSAL